MPPVESGDLLIRNGTVFDGSGNHGLKADVWIRDGYIANMVQPGAVRYADRELDATDKYVVPGFIDIHTHADFSLPRFPSANSMIRQGVTTIITGNCGWSPYPVGDRDQKRMLQESTSVFGRELDWAWNDLASFHSYLAASNPAVNVGSLVGHASLRIATMGFENRKPEAFELTKMKSLLADAMTQGALGLSSGLIYAPGSYASQDELIALCETAVRYGGFYATHIRNEGERLVEAVEEALFVAKASKIPLQLSHHKVLGRRNWGLTNDSLTRIDTALSNGMDIVLDQYPYTASSTTMMALIPDWASSGGAAMFRLNSRNAEWRAAVKDEVLNGPRDGRPKRDFEPDTVLISSVSNSDNRSVVGKTLGEIATELYEEPVDVMLDLLARDDGIEVVIFAIGEDDIKRVMRHHKVAIASDGWTLDPEAGGQPHPRSYGTYVRVFEKYVRNNSVLDWASAIHKMTQLPASRLQLRDRGRLEKGMRADIVVFDPSIVSETASYLFPHSYADGVTNVFVNGVETISDGRVTGRRGGMILHGSGGVSVHD